MNLKHIFEFRHPLRSGMNGISEIENNQQPSIGIGQGMSGVITNNDSFNWQSNLIVSMEI